MDRREFLSASACGLMTSTIYANGVSQSANRNLSHSVHFGISYEEYLSSGKKRIDQKLPGTRFSIEDYGFCSRSARKQKEISGFLAKENLSLGLFAGLVNYGQPLFSSGRKEDQQTVLNQLNKNFKLTKPALGKHCSIIPGKRTFGSSWKQQSSHAVELLKSVVTLAEKEDVILLLEPVNYLNKQPDMFLNSLEQAYEICERVHHPHCQILFEMRQQLILNGDIRKEISQFGNRIGYYQFENSLPLFEDIDSETQLSQILNEILSLNREAPIIIGNCPAVA